MNLIELKNKVAAELLSRNLDNPQIRLAALDKVCAYIKTDAEIFNADNIRPPEDRNKMKDLYKRYKAQKNASVSELSGAEKSIINEIYNQYLS